MSDTPTAAAQRVSGSVLRGLVSYVRRTLGDDELGAALVEAGVTIDVDDEALDMQWFDSDVLARLIPVAERRCGDPDIGRRAGEEMFRFRPDLQTMYHSTGSIEAALRVVIDLGGRTRTDPALRVVESGETHLVVHGDQAASRFGCGAFAGHWSQVPSLFGSTGSVAEPLCRSRGDDRCEYRVAWSPVDHAEGAEALRESRGRTRALVSRFEELQSLAAELVAEETTDGLVHRIAERAGSAVLTPSVVVAVRLADDRPLTVGWTGVEPAHARATAEAVATGSLEPCPDLAVAPISSPRRAYGHIVVLAQPGSVLSSNELRMLDAYAVQATAAIEAAAALEAARRERDAAESLLGLARALSELGTTAEIAQRIAEAVPTVVPCDLAAVMLWEPDGRAMRFVGAWPHPVDTLGIERFHLDEIPAAAPIIEDHAAASISLADADSLLRSLMLASGAEHLAAAPILVRGELDGVVLAAGTTEQSTVLGTQAHLSRLTGLADHAATAIDNSRLLERVRHQALHDPLTGLPNRLLIEDRVAHALEVAQRVDSWVTLLFIDLDKFKEINDQFGHAAGDRLLTLVAQRLRSCVRSSDTVSRLGGDEFLILLENTCGDEDGARVASKVIESLTAPFDVGGRTATVSVSIGITSAPGRDTSYEALLHRADEAMYAVKQQGRDGWSVFGVGTGSCRRDVS
ncbi:MAG: diguanylate cyclase domain-containing protein [Acidimicrobiales bacterium]